MRGLLLLIIVTLPRRALPSPSRILLPSDSSNAEYCEVSQLNCSSSRSRSRLCRSYELDLFFIVIRSSRKASSRSATAAIFGSRDKDCAIRLSCRIRDRPLFSDEFFLLPDLPLCFPLCFPLLPVLLLRPLRALLPLLPLLLPLAG